MLVRRVTAGAACLALLGAVAVSAPAGAGVGEEVLNPGPVTFTVDAGGFLGIGQSRLPLASAADPPACSDGLNSDVAADDPTQYQDPYIDFDGGTSAGVVPPTQPDTGCSDANDDNEAVGGSQPRQYVTLTGSVAADGTVTIPQSGITFPTTKAYAANASNVVEIRPTATGPATGVLHPGSGERTLELQLGWETRVIFSIFGVTFDCSATASAALSNDEWAPTNLGTEPVAPQPYDAADGSATITSNSFEVGPMEPHPLWEGSSGAATAGSTTFTDPSAPFTAGDVNKNIQIAGAGTAGGPLEVKISSVVDSSTVELSSAAQTSVAPTTYALSVSTPAQCDTMAGGLGLEPGTVTPAGPSAVQLGLTSDVVFESGLPTARIAGTVSAAGSGDGVPGVVVTLMRAHPSWRVVATTVTDGAGDYAFDVGYRGSYDLRFFDGTGTYQRTWYSSAPTYSTADHIDLVDGTAPPVDQVLEPLPGGALAGRALTSANAPIPGIRVLVYSQTDGFYASAVTGANGYYLVRGVPAGDYLIQFVDPTHTYRQQWFNFVALAFNADPVTVGTSTVWASALMGT